VSASPWAGGSDVAIERPGLILIEGDLGGIVRARRLSAATMTNIRPNVIFTFLYKAARIPTGGRPVPPVVGLRLSPRLRRDGPCLALRLKGAKLAWPRLECH
jgi:cation transport ATPase